MPLTAKGSEILKNLEKEYGAKKGEQVLYAGKNKGTFTGIDSMDEHKAGKTLGASTLEKLDAVVRICESMAQQQLKMCDAIVADAVRPTSVYAKITEEGSQFFWVHPHTGKKNGPFKTSGAAEADLRNRGLFPRY